MMKSNYLLKAHEFYQQRVDLLKSKIIKLKKNLLPEVFLQHELVKFAFRLRKATEEVIPENPDKPEYRLKGSLKKYRRYKQGLTRYRLIFFFSSHPPVIVYLYINDEKHLRKEGDKNDPYHEFSRLVERGVFTANGNDPLAKEWIRNFFVDM
jgi:toxin YhaV